MTLGPCIEWDGSHRQGYGRVQVRNRGTRPSYAVHRLVWKIFHGPIPSGMCVCHHRDSPPCIRVDHMFLGTQADNTADRHLGPICSG